MTEQEAREWLLQKQTDVYRCVVARFKLVNEDFHAVDVQYSYEGLTLNVSKPFALSFKFDLQRV